MDNTKLTEEQLRKNPAYCEMMSYVNHKQNNSGPILGKSPVADCIESFKKLDESLLRLRKEIDKDKKVVKLSDYRF